MTASGIGGPVSFQERSAHEVADHRNRTAPAE
jgi:hypothetical protein